MTMSHLSPQTPVGMKPENRPQNVVDSQVNTPTTSTGATPHPHSLAPYARAAFGTPSTITNQTSFNRAVSVPGGPPNFFASPSNQVPLPGQDVINVRNELLKALPFYKNIYANIENQPEVLSRLDILHYLGVNIHHPHIVRPGGLGSLLGVWDQLAGCSNKQIRDLNNENASLKHEISNLMKKVADLEASNTQPSQQVNGTQDKGSAKEPALFDGSEPNKYVRYFNFMLWKRDIIRAWTDKPDDFKRKHDKICYILYYLDGDAFWGVVDTAKAVINSNQSSDTWEFKTGEELLDHLTEKYGKRE
ncbi:hypothetical protein QBC41DRAFT_314796 [Cercophora samala]|uniref:Uncharacterized protein n=1 Tax=Cercophora samala TaxID=330535 RepID=A0AA39ZJH8_9PEZI|nr:hypothetical protein QBC41DRAFT_314796 [Cercophora samala]